MNKVVKFSLWVLLSAILVIVVLELSGISKLGIFHREEELITTDPFLPSVHVEEQGQEATPLPKTIIEFEHTTHNFGKILEGQKVRHTYKFKNTGDQPLVISNVETSCGCTAPDYSKTPVMPGGTGEITLEFDSKNNRGAVNKNAIVISNALQERISIGFMAEVE
jgi:hypothetical protein